MDRTCSQPSALGLRLELRHNVLDGGHWLRVSGPLHFHLGGTARAYNLGSVHPVAAMDGLDMVRPSGGRLPVAVEAVPLPGRGPEAGGDLAGVEVVQIVFNGRGFLLLSTH